MTLPPAPQPEPEPLGEPKFDLARAALERFYFSAEEDDGEENFLPIARCLNLAESRLSSLAEENARLLTDAGYMNCSILALQQHRDALMDERDELRAELSGLRQDKEDAERWRAYSDGHAVGNDELRYLMLYRQLDEHGRNAVNTLADLLAARSSPPPEAGN